MNITRKVMVSSLAMMVSLGITSGAVWAQSTQDNTKLNDQTQGEAQRTTKGATPKGAAGSDMKMEGGAHGQTQAVVMPRVHARQLY